MGVQYRLDILNVAGAKVAEIGGTGAAAFLDLSVVNQLNAPGMVTFALNYQHAAVALMSPSYQVEVWRRWPEMAIDWYRFSSGIYRDDTWEQREGREVVIFGCPGPLAMLGWRINAYPAETSNKTSWSSKSAETILKNLITNNMTSTGTTGNGRDRNATSSGTINGMTFTVEADSARGTSLDYKTTRNVLLKDCQDIVNAAGAGDFDLIKTAASTWQFRYYPLRGTDRSATVEFSTAIGNMRNPKIVRTRSSEQTAIIVGGGGTGSRRARITRTGANYNSASNDVEGFADGASTTGGTTSTSVLNGIGDKEANQRRMRPILTYDVAQVSASIFDKHYFLGDKTTAKAYGITVVQQVVGVAMHMSEQGEDMNITMREY